MPGTMSPYLRQTMLTAVFMPAEGQTRWVEDAWLALTRAVPAENASSDQLDEPTEGGYTRVPVSIGTDFWTPTGFGEIYNVYQLTFPVPSSSWGLITGWALLTSEFGGYLLASGTMVDPTEMVQDVRPIVEPGSIVIGYES